MKIDPVDHLSYHRWATNTLLDASAALDPEALHRDLGVPNVSIFGTLGHIFFADQVWLSRVAPEPAFQMLKAEPAQGLAMLRREWSAVHEKLIAWARRLSPEDCERRVEYVQSSGKQFATPGWEIVLHLVNHGTLHRGQAMAMFRQVGVKAPGNGPDGLLPAAGRKRDKLSG